MRSCLSIGRLVCSSHINSLSIHSVRTLIHLFIHSQSARRTYRPCLVKKLIPPFLPHLKYQKNISSSISLERPLSAGISCHFSGSCKWNGNYFQHRVPQRKNRFSMGTTGTSRCYVESRGVKVSPWDRDIQSRIKVPILCSMAAMMRGRPTPKFGR